MHITTGPAAPKRRILALLLGTAAMVAGAGPAEAASLMETVRTALETNPDVGVVKSDRRAVDQELRQARAGYLPQVDLRAAAGPEYTHNSRFVIDDGDDDETLFRSEAQLTLTQMLFDGYATRAEVARQRARVDSAAYRVAEAAEFVALNAIEAHLEVLRNQEIMALNEANVQQHERYLGQVGELERSGRGDISQVRQTEARLGRARENLAIARGNLADVLANYQRIVGERPVDLEDADAPATPLPASSEAAASLASYNSPTVFIAAADVDVGQAELKAAKSGFYPELDLQLGAGAGNNLDGVEEDVYDASALLVMRYNLFRGGADVALEREAFHRLNEARAALVNARRDAEQEARLSYNALETARARVATLGDQAEAQRRTRDAYASQFDIGQRDLLDLLDAENEYFLDRVSLITAQYTETFAAYRVLAVIGELLDTLDVAKPRESIDIYRRPESVPTPERIEDKSEQLYSPKAEPRYLRREVAGEPPAYNRDAAPHVGREGVIPERGEFYDPNQPAPGSEPRRTLFDYFRSTPPDEQIPGGPMESSASPAPLGALPGTSVEPLAVLPAAGPAQEEPEDQQATPAQPADAEVGMASGPVQAGQSPAPLVVHDSFDSFFTALFGEDGVGESVAIQPTVAMTETVVAEAPPTPLAKPGQEAAMPLNDLEAFLQAVTEASDPAAEPSPPTRGLFGRLARGND